MSELVVVNGPLSLYWAPVGEAFPDVDSTPAGNWSLIGASGADNYTEDGVTVSPNQTVEPFTPLGSTAPTKAFRTNEDLVVAVTLADLSLDQVRLAFNQNAITSAVGPPAIDSFDLARGVTVQEMALLIRGEGKSPEFATGNIQFELFRVYEGASQELGFVKGEPAGVLLEFHAMKDSVNGVGRFVAQTA